ncbi:hypothetical protein [Flavobacterium sp. CAN_S2]|uniref:hypothetical protein n=1 Tax=Flavobacterium sp. CAN_S2 TaxID=2787726 RepID=UPI0018CBD94F
MSKPKYLYIDDENDDSVSAVRDGFNDENLIEVSVEQPQDFKSQIKDLIVKLNDYDGLILDFRLNQNMQLDVAYNAPAIAQELRMSVAEPEINVKSIPIILCSTDERMRATYDADMTSHDLFDYKFLKGDEPDWERFSRKLNSLAIGYKYLNEAERSFEDVIKRSDTTGLDPRIIERFKDPARKYLSYDFANFIVKSLFNHPGALIKERVLAARLGVDIEASGQDWSELLDKLNDYKYKGLFSDGWNRWWMDKINIVFKEISKGKRLSNTNAQQRVAILSEFYALKNLKAAEPIRYCTSTSYWTICEETKRPLDPLDGFKVFETVELKSWQEPKYLSFYAIADAGIKRKGLREQFIEKERIQYMKESLKNEN